MSPLLTWYGDDFSGSTDVMEALERNGIPAVLFLRTPTDAELSQFPEARAIGIAGVSRSQTPAWMSEHLPPVFRALHKIAAPICHYKVCSTFDSSPEIGSIGRAMDLGQEIFQSDWVPLVVGAPILRRYTVFGNLYATADGETYRIDRHPTMSRHPVTPMHESDLRVHLAAQTAKKVGSIDILALRSNNPDERVQNVLASGAEALLFDILDEESLQQTGRLIWSAQQRAGRPFLAVASSGLEYALAAWWRASGEVAVHKPTFSCQPVDRIIAVSGSCSPVTESQIRHAAANGFEGIPLDVRSLIEAGEAGSTALQQAAAALSNGRSVVLYTALGPGSAITLDAAQGDCGARDRIGAGLGRTLKRLIGTTGVNRVVVAGGDTSGHAARELDITAIRMVQPMAPGSPLCRVCGARDRYEGLEILFKGGQVGGVDFFNSVLTAGRN